MEQSIHDFNKAFGLILERDPSGLALAASFLESETEGDRHAYDRSILIYWILKSELNLTPVLDRLRSVFLRDFLDTQDHDRYWFPWGRQIVQQIANPEIRQKISEYFDDPNPRIRRRARLISTYLDYSRIQAAQACLARLLHIKNEAEFNRNSTYATVWQSFFDLVTVQIERAKYYQRWQDRSNARRKFGGEHAFSIPESADWRKSFDTLAHGDSSALIDQTINRIGEKKIKNHDPIAIEAGILYLEADPYWQGSSYDKEWLLDQLKYLDLTLYSARLQSILLHVVDTHYCREFRHYCKVAARIDSEEFRDALRSRLNNPDPNVGQRAQWLLSFLERYGKLASSGQIQATP